MDTHTREVVASIIEADAKIAAFLRHAAYCLREGCNPVEVSVILDSTARDVEDSIARNQELLG